MSKYSGSDTAPLSTTPQTYSSMRSLLGFLATVATLTTETTALEASVISFGLNPQGQGLKSSVTSSATLQRLLELRSKSFTASELEGSDENRIDFLGRFAGTPGQLFGALVGDGDLDTITVILEGLDNEAGTSTSPSLVESIILILMKHYSRIFNPK